MPFGYLGLLVVLLLGSVNELCFLHSASEDSARHQFSLLLIMPVQSKLDWDMFPGVEVQILFLSCVNLGWLLGNAVLKTDTCWGAPCVQLG